MIYKGEKPSADTNLGDVNFQFVCTHTQVFDENLFK